MKETHTGYRDTQFILLWLYFQIRRESSSGTCVVHACGKQKARLEGKLMTQALPLVLASRPGVA